MICIKILVNERFLSIYKNSSEFLFNRKPSIDAVKKLLAEGHIIFCRQASNTATELDKNIIDKKVAILLFTFLLNKITKINRIIN